MVNDVKVKESCGQTRWEAANGAYGLISECRWKPASNSRRQWGGKCRESKKQAHNFANPYHFTDSEVISHLKYVATHAREILMKQVLQLMIKDEVV